MLKRQVVVIHSDKTAAVVLGLYGRAGFRVDGTFAARREELDLIRLDLKAGTLLAVIAGVILQRQRSDDPDFTPFARKRLQFSASCQVVTLKSLPRAVRLPLPVADAC